MEYPHRQFLLYLVSRQLNFHQVVAQCVAKDLMPPSTDDFDLLGRELGPVPKFWRATVDPQNAEFIRWLRDHEILALWRRPKVVRDAMDFLFVSDMRREFEALVLIHGSVREARKELLLKHQEKLVPTEDVLEVFCDNFWNLGSMSKEGLFEFLKAGETRRELLPALRGDIVTTYNQLGLRRQIQTEALYDEFIAYVDQQVYLHRRDSQQQTGYTNAGLAALMRQAQDAKDSLEQLRISSGDADEETRREIAKFRLRKPKPVRGFISIDELSAEEEKERVVIDAEYEDCGNVRKFPAKSGS